MTMPLQVAEMKTQWGQGSTYEIYKGEKQLPTPCEREGLLVL